MISSLLGILIYFGARILPKDTRIEDKKAEQKYDEKETLFEVFKF